MFVRFRVQYRRLQASLVESKRRDGKMVAEHIGGLGSVDAELSVRERVAFWAALPARLAKLGNRVMPDAHEKIYGSLHARIPKVTPDEQMESQEEQAKAEPIERLRRGEIDLRKFLKDSGITPTQWRHMKRVQFIFKMGGGELLNQEVARRIEKVPYAAVRDVAAILEVHSEIQLAIERARSRRGARRPRRP